MFRRIEAAHARRAIVLIALSQILPLALLGCTDDSEGETSADDALATDDDSTGAAGSGSGAGGGVIPPGAATTGGSAATGGATPSAAAGPSADDAVSTDDAAANPAGDDGAANTDSATPDDAAAAAPGNDGASGDDSNAADDAAAAADNGSATDDTAADDDTTATDATAGSDDAVAADDTAADDTAADDTAADDDTTVADDNTGSDDAPIAQPACDASSAPVIGGLGLQTAFTSSELNGVSYAVQPPDSDDWYFVEQRGRIMVLTEGALRPTPFYDVTSEIQLDALYDERGLHSIAFAPDYAASGLFYIVLIPTTGERANRDLVLEHKRSAADSYVADMAVTRELLNLPGRDSTGLFDNLHNAYMAKFGPDGMLYVGMGDGGGECNNNVGFEDLPQDITSAVGKLLRFDLSQPEPWGATDNPFVSEGGDPRIFHYGLRNPFRFSWDQETGDLYIGDVGQDTHEEINVAPGGSAGLNFGWAAFEGEEATCSGRALSSGSDTPVDPIFFSTHGGGAGLAPACSTSAFCDYSAIVGGTVYRGAAVDTLRGAYLFGDWAGNNMAALYQCDGAVSEVTVIDYKLDLNLPNNGYFDKVGDGVPDVQNITAIVEDHSRELYLVANGNALLKIVPAP